VSRRSRLAQGALSFLRIFGAGKAANCSRAVCFTGVGEATFGLPRIKVRYHIPNDPSELEEFWTASIEAQLLKRIFRQTDASRRFAGLARLSISGSYSRQSVNCLVKRRATHMRPLRPPLPFPETRGSLRYFSGWHWARKGGRPRRAFARSRKNRADVKVRASQIKCKSLLSIICQDSSMATSAVPALFAAIEAIVGYDGNGMPPGAISRVQRIADLLKYEHAPLAAFAEQTAIDLHLLRDAALQGDARAQVVKGKLASVLAFAGVAISANSSRRPPASSEKAGDSVTLIRVSGFVAPTSATAARARRNRM
jgi:hypothetical protein